jgi:hypothetical protein
VQLGESRGIKNTQKKFPRFKKDPIKTIYITMKAILESWNKYLLESNLAWYGSKQDFDDFDLSQTTEFGYHFGFDKEQSKHRIGDEGVLFHVELDYNNPLEMVDVIRWSLDSVLRELGVPLQQIREYKKLASSKARSSGRSMRVEENILLSQILDRMGYDAIEYDNKGEGGGRAVVIWNPSLIHVKEKETLS